MCVYSCSVAKSCLTLCDAMNCSLPDSSVLHYLPEFAQIHDTHLYVHGPVLYMKKIEVCLGDVSEAHMVSGEAGPRSLFPEQKSLAPKFVDFRESEDPK